MMEQLLKQCLVVGMGGFFGAMTRYLVAVGINSRFGGLFPWATFVINISGSFVLGLLATLLLNQVLVSPNWRLFVTIGFIGAYTTFSTFEYESAALGLSWAALANLVGSVVAGYAAVWIGIRLGSLWPHGGLR